MADTYISRAATGNVTSDKTWTFSFWLKRGDLNRTQTIFMHENAASHNEKFQLELQSDNTFRVSVYDGSTEFNYDTNMLFRDTSGWYNVVVRWDTTQSTSTDRVRIYVNGSQITFDNANGSTATMPNQNFALDLGEKIMVWGRYQASSPGAYFNGSLSYCQYADGQSYAPTTFGSIDSVTGQWKINTNATVTYGDNGFFILKNGNRVINDAGNSSGNFAVSGGTLTDTKDCPDNNFATLNPLDVSLPSTFTLKYGNLENLTLTSTDVGGNNTYGRAFSTLQVASGKFYAEMKWVNTGSAGMVAVTSRSGVITSQYAYLGKQNEDWRYYHDGTKMNNNSSSSYGDSQANGDIVGVALDLDNLKIYFSKNGTWQNSGNPESGATGTGAAFTLTAPNLTSNGAYKFGIGTQGGQNVKGTWNFGNGYFGTSAITTNSGNGYAGAEGASKFNYQPPSGYSALNTKGLNQ